MRAVILAAISSVAIALAAATPGSLARAEPDAAPPAAAKPDTPADTAPAETAPAGATAAETASREVPSAKPGGTMESICLILEAAAQANDLPLAFFARVIWQESRFRPDAIGPMTRSGHRAQGIAQFMPYTAEERGLLDPFDPVAALPKSAEFLRELREQFGNLGLAAAAYNAGPRRVRDWLDGRGKLPAETRNYVLAITGRSAEDWADLARQGGKDGFAKQTSCTELAALLKERPSFFIGELERRVREGRSQPWGVQLSAGFSRARVLAAYAAIERRYRGDLERHDPMIIRSVLRSRGTSAFYQVRVGAESRPAADKLCRSLAAKGAVCMVLRNSRGTPEAL